MEAIFALRIQGFWRSHDALHQIYCVCTLSSQVWKLPPWMTSGLVFILDR